MGTSHTNRRRFIKTSGVGAVTVALAGCFGGNGDDADDTDDTTDDDVGLDDDDVDTEDIPRGGEFTYGMPEEIEGLNMVRSMTAYTMAVMDLINAGGGIIDPFTSEVKPWAYSDWEIEEPDSDAPAIVFNVRDDLTWNDGTDFGVDDAYFTWEWYLDVVPTWHDDALGFVDYVEEADNGWDLRLQLTEPFSLWDSELLTLPQVPQQEWDDIRDDELEYETDDPVGLGPGRVTSIDHDVAATVELRGPDDGWPMMEQERIEEHDHFRAGGPFLDEIRFSIYGSASALHEAFLQGEVDAIHDRALSAELAGRADDEDGVENLPNPSAEFHHYTFNLTREPFHCITFRQALSMCLDRVEWTDVLNEGYAVAGNYINPWSHEVVRPDTYEDGVANEHPAAQALWFRESEPAVVDVDAIHEFLENGDVVAEEGTYAGQEFPGPISGVGPSQTEPQYEYTIDEDQSDILLDEGIEHEVYLDGQTIPELIGRPLEMHDYPPEERPQVVELTRSFVDNIRQIGIPIERNVTGYAAMIEDTYGDMNYDIFPMSLSNIDPFGVSNFNVRFAEWNSAWDPDELDGRYFGNPLGYGLPDRDGRNLPGDNDRIREAMTTMDVDERNRLAREINERIYLDAPHLVKGYNDLPWPVNADDFGGYLYDFPGTGSAQGLAPWQATNVYQRE